MKIFELRPNENLLKVLKDSHNPWEPWYDKAFGFIVRAETETEARKIADENAGDENKEIANKTPWLNKKYSTCIELTENGEAGLIMKDYKQA